MYTLYYIFIIYDFYNAEDSMIAKSEKKNRSFVVIKHRR